MPRLHGVRERRHQPLYDTLIRTTGATPSPTISSSTRLFGSANVGQPSLNNLQTPGQLASDQTYVILALRAWTYFEGTNRRALYLGVHNQLYWTLVVGDKPMFQAPTWYFPAGGGTWGVDTSATTASIFNNGVPSQEAIMKLGRPIPVPVRQPFTAVADFFAIGSTAVLTTINSGATDDQKVIAFVVDGLQTRDVQ